MELVHGVTLRRKLEGEESWRVMMPPYLQAARGLAAAHAAGLVHRDSKPDNVLVGDDDRVRVGDFGLVSVDPLGATRQVRDPPRSLGGASETTGRIVGGTLAYMSLEAIRGGPVDTRADQFSFCVAMFRQIYGVFPYAGDTLAEREAQILHRRIERPDSSLTKWTVGVTRPPRPVGGFALGRSGPELQQLLGSRASRSIGGFDRGLDADDLASVSDILPRQDSASAAREQDRLSACIDVGVPDR